MSSSDIRNYLKKTPGSTEDAEKEFVLYQPPSDTMNTAQRAAFDAVMAGKSIFLTGPGGTGKSFLLQNLHDQFKLRGKMVKIYYYLVTRR